MSDVNSDSVMFLVFSGRLLRFKSVLSSYSDLLVIISFPSLLG